MKKLIVFAIMAMVVFGMASCDSKKSVSLKTELDSVSYAIGASYGRGLKTQFSSAPGDPINWDAFKNGFTTYMDKDDSLFLGKSEQEITTFVNSYFERAMKVTAQKTKEEGEKFLADNKTKSGVITTESGLQYKVITEGKGIKPTVEDTVVVHYTGKFINGEEFDSSIARGEPAQFPLGDIIAGWVEGIQLMPVGSKYYFWIPSELAYGENGRQNIKPNSTLFFEVELLDVKQKK